MNQYNIDTILDQIDEVIQRVDYGNTPCQESMLALEEQYYSSRQKYSILELSEIFPEARIVIKQNIAETIILLKDVWERIQSSVLHYQVCPDAKPICMAVIEIIDETERKPLESKLNRLEYNLSRLDGKNNNGVDAEDIKDRVNLQDVVCRYGIKYRKMGKECITRCPFHADKTPSFTFSQKLYHCFGCGKSGDVISFVEEIERCDFTEALKKLA